MIDKTIPLDLIARDLDTGHTVDRSLPSIISSSLKDGLRPGILSQGRAASSFRAYISLNRNLDDVHIFSPRSAQTSTSLELTAILLAIKAIHIKAKELRNKYLLEQVIEMSGRS